VEYIDTNMTTTDGPKFPANASFFGTIVPSAVLGGVAGSLVSVPLALGITVFDRSIIEVAALRAKGTAASLPRVLGQGFMRVLRTPHVAFMGKDNLAVNTVYGSTYIARNATESTCHHMGIDSGMPIFIMSSLVNCPLSIWKDKVIAKMYNQSAAKLPMSTYGCFITRDSIVVGVSFVGPRYLSPVLKSNFDCSQFVADTAAQLLCPGLSQLIATPLHLVGLDLYNRPTATLGEHISFAIRTARGPILTRMLRQVYVFGFGSVLNKEVNKYFQSFV